MRTNKKKFFSASTEAKIRLTNEHRLFRKVYKKYLIIRIRQKISFMAFEKRMTVFELFIKSILTCYLSLMMSGAIKQESSVSKASHRKIFEYLSSRGNHGTLARLALFNKNKFQADDKWLREKLKTMEKYEATNEKFNKQDAKTYTVYHKATGEAKQKKSNPVMTKRMTALIE